MPGVTCLMAQDEYFVGRDERTSLEQAGVLATYARTSHEAWEKLALCAWDVVLVDLDLRDGLGFAVAARAAEVEPRPTILVTSGCPEHLAVRCIHELEVPVVPKAILARSLGAWIAAAFAGSRGSMSTRTARLSRREAAIFALLAKGRAPKEIAYELGLSHATIRTHARNAYRKLGASNLRETLALLRVSEASIDRTTSTAQHLLVSQEQRA